MGDEYIFIYGQNIMFLSRVLIYVSLCLIISAKPYKFSATYLFIVLITRFYLSKIKTPTFVENHDIV